MAPRLADDAWKIERFVSCFEVLADRLGTGRFVPERLASCTAEEMALRMVIDLAEAFVADGICRPRPRSPHAATRTRTSTGRARCSSGTTTC